MERPESDISPAVKVSSKAWKALIGACVVFGTTTPYLSVFELLYDDILELTGDRNLVGTWTFTIYLIMWNFTSLFVGPLCTMQSHRWTTSVGIFLMGAGAILSSFAKTGVDLYLSVGVVAGSGQGLVTNTAILILVDHFQEKQGLALGISFMVMAVAGIVSPQIVQLLSRAFTYNVSILIYAVQFLVGLIGSALFFPVDNIKVVTAPQEDAGGVDEVDAVHSRFDQSRHSQKVKRELQASVETADTTGKPLIKSNDDPAGKSGRGWRRNPCVLMFTLINWSLAKRPHFILTVLGSSYSFNALMSFFLFLPLYAESIHCSTYQKSVLLSVVAGVDLVTRFLFAWMGDWKCIQKVFKKPRRMLYAISVIGICTVMICLPMFESFSALVGACCIYGIFAGGIPGNGPMVYAESFKEDLASAMGLASIGRALAALSMGPLANVARSQINGVQISLWATGGISLFWMILWISETLCCSSSSSNKPKLPRSSQA